MLEANLTTIEIPELIVPFVISESPGNLQTESILADDDIRRRAHEVPTCGFMLSKAARDWHTSAHTSHSSYVSDENTAEMLRRVSNALSVLDGVEAGKTSPSHRT